MEKLILTSGQCPGDMVMLTAALRDLHAAHPGRYLTDVRTPHPDMFSNNPHVTRLTEGREIPMHYDLIHQSNGKPWHFIHGYRMHLENVLGITIPQGAFRGDIHLTHAEKTTRPAGVPDRYWVVASGGKLDFTAKWWDPARWQAVVDYWAGKGIKFVQVGGKGDVHPSLHGVTNLVGKTTLRQLIHIIAHADGVLCPVTSLMHISAALPMADGRIRPCVVVAGGREPSQWEAYPGQQYLDTIGQLPCCASGGCWKSRVVPLGADDKSSLCVSPIEVREGVHIPECLDRITSTRVIDAMSRYMQMPAVPAPLAVKPCTGCGRGGAAKSTDPKIWGPVKWRELHHRAGRADDPTLLDEPKEAAWIGKFIAGLPCVECREEATKLLVAYPPQLQSRDAYRWWGIEFHNAVNRRLGKPVLSIEQAEEKIAASLPRAAAAIHQRHMICAKCEHYGNGGGPLVCKLDGRTLTGKLINGDCEKWPGYVTPSAPPPKVLQSKPAVDGALFDNRVGVVIGTFAAVPYVHLQLEAARRIYPGTPILVHDDGSPHRDRLAELCQDYGADFVGASERKAQFLGDVSVYRAGILWAQERGIKYLLKLSRRWIWLEDWRPSFLDLADTTDADTFSHYCTANGFGFRTECVGFKVAAWHAIPEWAERVIAADKNIFVEYDLHRLAEQVSKHGSEKWKKWDRENKRQPDRLGYVPWPLMGTSRHTAVDSHLWHNSHRPSDYAALARSWGLGYTAQDFADPNAGCGDGYAPRG